MLDDQDKATSAHIFPEAVEGNWLYVDLVKKCVTDLIYVDHPLAAYNMYQVKDDARNWKTPLIKTLEKLLLRYKIRLVEPFGHEIGPEISTSRLERQRENGEGWPARAHTMIGMKALNNLQYCVETVLREEVPGDLIETGVWRGGACIFMRAILKGYEDTDRTVWAADSFSGLPPPSQDYPADAGGVFHTFDELAISLPEVKTNFARYGLLDDQVRFLQGWFKDTLPSAPIEQLAVLRLDGDMYESTIQVLDALYDKLSPGGFVIVDDYWLPPCAQAVHEFRESREISDEILDINGRAAYWRRSL